ncbi:hypothetical protein [Labilibaculum sp.]|uniref:hypothetical protein n=1 Tax=Labilibaculum sp. TaxID=2060723 RepID=UPI003564B79B
MNILNRFSFTDSFSKLALLLLFLLFHLFSYGDKLNVRNSSKFSLESISLVQNSINVNRSSETLFFSLKAYSQYGLNRVTIYFISPSGNVILNTSCINRKKSQTAFLLGRMLFKKKSENGEWKIEKIIIQDSEGNQQSFDNTFLIQNNFAHSFFITGN